MTPAQRRIAEGRARRIQSQETQAKAVELRKRGMSYRAIALQLGISFQGVHKAVKKAMDQIKAHVYIDANTIRTMELEKLDALELVMWSAANKGSHNAANTIIKSIETRAKLMGLNAPEKHANTDSQGEDLPIPQRLRDMSADEIKARIRELQGEADGGASK